MAAPATAPTQQVAAPQNAVMALFSRLKDLGSNILSEVRFPSYAKLCNLGFIGDSEQSVSDRLHILRH